MWTIGFIEEFRFIFDAAGVIDTDDHFRNHGFLLTQKGWTLSPAYDMNPTLNEYQSLLINSSTNKSFESVVKNKVEKCDGYLTHRMN